MELQGISEIDLNGILFVHFPDDTPLDECRDRLELLVYEAYEAEYDGVAEEERMPLVLSPYWIYRALFYKAEREFGRLSRRERRAVADEARKARAESVAATQPKMKGLASGD